MILSKKELYEAIRLARPLLIIFICIAHIPDVKGYVSEADQWQSLETLVSVFVLDFLVRGAVPILTVVSGYLAFQSFQKRSYQQLISEKAKRLLWPFVVWNFLAIGVYWWVYKSTGYAIANIAVMDNLRAISAALLGLNLNMPINVSTYFVRDLFVIILFLPLIHIITRYTWLTLLLLLSVIGVLWLTPSIVLRVGEFEETILFRVDMIFFFTLGYYLSSKTITIPKASSFTVVTLFVLMLVVGMSVSIYLSQTNASAAEFNHLRLFMGVFFVVTAPALFRLLLLSKSTPIGKLFSWLSPYSFTLFLSHVVVTQLFQYVFWQVIGWKESEYSSLAALAPYTLCYVAFLIVGAVIIRQGWLLLSKAGTQALNYLTRTKPVKTTLDPSV